MIALTSGGPREPTQIDHIAFTASDVRVTPATAFEGKTARCGIAVTVVAWLLTFVL